MEQQEKKNVLALYAAFLLAGVLCFLPLMMISSLAAFALIAVLILSYGLRGGKARSGAYYLHLVYIARTWWAWSCMAGFLLALAGFIVFTQGDNSGFDTVADNIMNGTYYNAPMLRQVLMDYIALNFSLIMLAAGLSFLPPTLYLLYRVVSGARCARKDCAPANSHSWI